MKKILKDPLVHFLVLGLGLFILFGLVAGDDAAYDSKVINVDRDALLTFVQYRSGALEPQAAPPLSPGSYKKRSACCRRDP